MQLEEVIQPKVPRLFDLEYELDETPEPHLENAQEDLNRYRCEKFVWIRALVILTH